MFEASNAVIINKMDLVPHLQYDLDLTVRNIQKVNPKAEILKLSAATGEGVDVWYRWIKNCVAERRSKISML